MNVFELFGKIAIDGKGAMSGIDQTVGHAKNAENSLTKTFKKIGTAVAAAFTVRAVVDFGKQCTEAYANIAAEESAFAQIMGDYADTAQAKLNAVADQTGIASTRMTGAMTSLTAKFKGLGYDTADATTLATDGLLIAADAAAFWDMSLDESMSHLNSFINGSYEGGEAIGLFANDTQMAAYAIAEGIVKDAKAWAQLDEAQKQATRLAYAKQMMESSGAVGQAAKESQQYANTMANLKESWRQFQGVIGKPILEKIVLPAMQRLLKTMPALTEAVQVGIDWLSAGFDKVSSYFSDVFTEDGLNMDALPDALSNMFRDLGRAIPGLLRSVGSAIKGAWSNGVWPAIQGLFSAVFGIELPSWEQLKQNIADGWNNTVWPAVQGYFSQKFGIDLPSWEQLKQNIVDGWNNTVWPVIKDLFSVKFSVDEPMVETLTKHLSEWWNTNIAPALSNVFEATFGVKPEDSDGTEVGKKLREWWDSVVAVVGDIFKAIFSVDTEDDDGAATGEKIKAWFSSVMTYVGNIFKGLFGVELDDASEVVEKIKAWWDGVLAELGDYIKISIGLPIESGSGVTTNEDGLSQGGGGMRFGDPAEGGWTPQLRNWRQYPGLNIDGTGGSTGIQGVLSAFAAQVETAAKAGSAAGVAEGMSGITVTGTITTGSVKLDSGVLVGQLAPQLDLKLGNKLGRA